MKWRVLTDALHAITGLGQSSSHKLNEFQRNEARVAAILGAAELGALGYSGAAIGDTASVGSAGSSAAGAGSTAGGSSLSTFTPGSLTTDSSALTGGDAAFSSGVANSTSSGAGSSAGTGGFKYSKFLSSALGNMGKQQGGGGSEPRRSQQINSSDYLVNAGALNPNSQQAMAQNASPDPYAPQNYGAYGAPYQQALRQRMLAAALSAQEPSPYG